ncbi:PRP3-domain-containing protein [Clavulina sp. PMI_390]|nr:PRP3-domain-containing protein [Clavulina sp. PMI_390]
MKSDSGSLPTASGASGSQAPLSVEAQIAKARAAIAAKVASYNQNHSNKLGGPSPASVAAGGGGPASVAAAVAASKNASAAAAAGAKAPTIDVTAMARQIAEAKRRALASQATRAVQENPYLSMPVAAGKKKAAAPVEPGPQGAGLKMAAHPLLLDSTPIAPQSNKERYKPMQPKFASIKASNTSALSLVGKPAALASASATANPYAAAAASGPDSGFEGAPKERVGKSFKFNQKGKYVAQAEQLRKDAQLEALKQRIAERAGRAGLDSEFEGMEKNMRREPPPEVEWWDASLLPNKTYDDLDLGFDALNIRGSGSPITELVQHPIPIPAPWDKNIVALKPLKLTKKEEKKIRRNRRKAEQQDKQDRIRMGLIPPDPPKVRLANLMKVLTSDAVQDPTKVEARVRREVAMRKLNHTKMNESRKLTDEQRREKIETKKTEEEKKGLYGAVYRIKTLSDPAHRFKVRKNAEQMGLTGLTIFNPHFSLVIVEGSAKAIKQYDRLMTVRIQWTEAAAARAAKQDEDGEDGEGDGEGEGEGEGGQNGAAGGSGAMQVDGAAGEGEQAAVSLVDNRCYKIWEGPLRDRAFKSFKAKPCPTDSLAKEALTAKWIGQWDLAKNFVPKDEL